MMPEVYGRGFPGVVLHLKKLMPQIRKQPGSGRIVVSEFPCRLELKPVPLRSDFEDSVAIVPGRVEPHERLEQEGEFRPGVEEGAIRRRIGQRSAIGEIRGVDLLSLESA